MNHGAAPPSEEPLGVKRNAVTLAMWQGIARLVGELAADPSVRVLVVRGAGDHFCAGADIAQLAALADPARGAAYREANRTAEDALATFPKPSVAVVQGFCIGGGCEIAVACDLRIVERGARFGITPARLGIVYPAFAVERVVKLIGAAATKYLLYSAELVDADRALRIGLVDEVHDPGGLEERVRAFSTTLAGLSLLTQRGAIDAELARTWEREAQAGPDVAEGIRAFTERERPRFTWTTRRERSTRTRER